MILYLRESAEWDLMALQSLIDWFLLCVLIELGEGRRRRCIQVVQSSPMIFVEIYYLSSSMYIKAFSCCTCFCPVIVISLHIYNSWCNINILDLAKMFRTRSQNTLEHTRDGILSDHKDIIPSIWMHCVSRTRRIRKTGEL